MKSVEGLVIAQDFGVAPLNTVFLRKRAASLPTAG